MRKTVVLAAASFGLVGPMNVENRNSCARADIQDHSGQAAMISTHGLPSETVVVRTPASDSDWLAARTLLLDYFDWLAPVAGVESVPAVQPAARAEISNLAAAFGGPGSRLLLAKQGRLGVGIVGLRPENEPGVVELVRFYCRPAARGAGVGTALITAAISVARSMRFHRIVLDTVPRIMPAAVRLYERHGFVPSDQPGELPVDDDVRFELDLRGSL